MVNKRLISRNYGTLVSKMVEYFKVKDIQLDILFKGYKGFLEELFATDYLKQIEAQKNERLKKDMFSKKFFASLEKKHTWLFDAQIKAATFNELKTMVSEKQAKDYISMAQKSNVLFKQQISAETTYDFIIRDLKLCLKEFLYIKNNPTQLKEIATKILKADVSNVFYSTLKVLLEGYDKQEKKSKIEALVKDAENSYDINSLFDDLFIKISKFEELVPFW